MLLHVVIAAIAVKIGRKVSVMKKLISSILLAIILFCGTGHALADAWSDMVEENASYVNRDIDTFTYLANEAFDFYGAYNWNKQSRMEMAVYMACIACEVGSIYGINDYEAFAIVKQAVAGNYIPINKIGIMMSDEVISQAGKELGKNKLNKTDKTEATQYAIILVLNQHEAVVKDGPADFISISKKASKDDINLTGLSNNQLRQLSRKLDDEFTDRGMASSNASAKPAVSSSSNETQPVSFLEQYSEKIDANIATDNVKNDEKDEYKAGQYKVGSDIPAGVYFASAEENAIIPYIEVKDGSGSDANTISYTLFDTFAIIGLRDGEYVRISEGTLSDISTSKDYVDGVITEGITDGMYEVGFHIPAGEYKTVENQGALIAYIAVYDDPYQDKTLDYIILDGNGYITLKDGNYVEISEATMIQQ